MTTNPQWRTRVADAVADADAVLFDKGSGEEGLLKLLSRVGDRPDTIMVSPEQYAMITMAHDRFGIYAQRQALAKAGIAAPIYRGAEWWH